MQIKKLMQKFFGKEEIVSNALQEELAAYYAQSKTLSQEQLVSELSTFSCESSPLISIVGASRKSGNPNSRIPYFFESLLKMTADITKVEVVFRLDDDDDLAFYHSIRKKFGAQVRMRFVIKKTVDGFRNLFALHSSAFEYTTPTSCIISLTTDDATFRKKNWDIHFIGFARSHKDNIFFINTSHPHLLNYSQKHDFYWHLWSLGPTACLPAVGRRVLTINKSVADKYPGWTPYGNNMLCDSFNESLQFHFHDIAQKRAPLAMMPHTLLIEEDKEIAAHKKGGLHSYSPVIIDCYRKIVSNQTQTIIREMANELYKAKGTEDHASRQLLEKDYAPTLPGDKVAISIVAKTYKENRGHGFYDQFLQSLIQNTARLSHVEVIFIMTDQVKYYEKLIKTYGDKVRITLLHANPTRRNGLSLFDEEMLTRLAPSSKMVCLVNEAVLVNKERWDQEILEISQKHSDGIYFINTHPSCTNQFENKHVYFWEMLRSGYPGFSQIISRRVLENIHPYACTRFLAQGNEYRLDYLFIGAVQYHYWQQTNEKRSYVCENIFVTRNEYVPDNPVYTPKDTFHNFMEPNVQNLFQNVATQLRQMTAQQAVPEGVGHE